MAGGCHYESHMRFCLAVKFLYKPGGMLKQDSVGHRIKQIAPDTVICRIMRIIKMLKTAVPVDFIKTAEIL